MSLFDDEDDKPRFNIKAMGATQSSSELDMDFDDYVRSFITPSLVNKYVLFSYLDDGELMVLDKGGIDHCLTRMKDIFEMGSVKKGMCILSIEEFSEMVQ